MSYGSAGGIEQKFGKVNADKWADLDNDDDLVKIAARKAAALEFASAEIDCSLADTHYRKPFQTSSGGVPNVITDLTNTLAGCWLKDPRGQTTFDERGSPVDSLSWHRTRAKQILEQINDGGITLDAI